MNRLYIAVENKNRELYAKVLLACVAAENGFDSVVGVNTEIKANAPIWKPGIIVWKGLAKKGGALYKNFHALGHKVVAWCEEGLVYPGSIFYQRYRVFPEALNELDLFFAWGQNQADDILEKIPEGKNKVVITGNPRLDILGSKYRGVFSEEMNRIRDEFGSFILINTNFSAYTHNLGPENVIDSLKKAGRIRSDEDELFYQGRAKNREKVFYAFREMIVKLSRVNKGIKIVLRPHSAESVTLWENAIAGLQNVFLIRQGSAMPWIMASELLIHNDCTTGLEAFMLDTPVVSYRPTAGNPYESMLPIAVSNSVEDEDDLVNIVSKLMGDKSRREIETFVNNDELLSQYIGNYKREDAVEKIINSLKGLAEEPKGGFINSVEEIYRNIQLKVRLSKIRLNGVLRFVMNRKDVNEVPRLKLKFTGLCPEEVEIIIHDLGDMAKRFSNLQVSAVPGTRTCIRIMRKIN